MESRDLQTVIFSDRIADQEDKIADQEQTTFHYSGCTVLYIVKDKNFVRKIPQGILEIIGRTDDIKKTRDDLEAKVGVPLIYLEWKR